MDSTIVNRFDPSMAMFALFVFLTGIIPLTVAWSRHRGTSLVYAVAWAMLAWLAWAIVLAQAACSTSELSAGRYAGLCLIVCAGVAVFGARHPRAGAWNFVVLGLLAVLLLPWMEGFLTGFDVQLSGVRAAFLGTALLLNVINYLATSHVLAAMLLGVGCFLELVPLLSESKAGNDAFLAWNVCAGLSFGLAPWIAWLSLRWRPAATTSVDAIWQSFRDRYGLAWAQLVREQFNRAVENAGYPVELGWHGLRATTDGIDNARDPDAVMQESCRVILESLLKRFGLLGTEAV